MSKNMIERMEIQWAPMIPLTCVGTSKFKDGSAHTCYLNSMNVNACMRTKGRLQGDSEEDPEREFTMVLMVGGTQLAVQESPDEVATARDLAIRKMDIVSGHGESD